MTTIAGLPTEALVPTQPEFIFVLAHGYGMSCRDLAPFARTLPQAACYFPQAPHAVEAGGRSWWPVDVQQRQRALSQGPRDLHGIAPEGLDAAAQSLEDWLAAVAARHPGLPLVLGGFSQGGMLACEVALRARVRPAALVLLSASRIAFDRWLPRRAQLQGLPAFVAHGRADQDLSFDAGQALAAFVADAGAQLEWLAFDGGHGMPMVVWSRLRRWLQRVLRQPSA